MNGKGAGAARLVPRGALRWMSVALGIALVATACARPSPAKPVGEALPAAATQQEGRRFYVFPDDGLAPLLQFIDGASRTLDVYVFELSNRDVEQRLVTAAKRGVTVRAVVEPEPTGRADEARIVFDRLRAGGVQAKLAGKQFSKTHVKSLVADHESAWIGTFNYVDDWKGTRDYAVVTDERATVAQLASTFDDDWNGRRAATSIDGESSLIISPVNGRSGVTAFLNSALFSIAIEHETLDDPAIIDLLGKRAKAGIEVSVLLEDAPENAGALRALRQVGPPLTVQTIKQPNLHAKMIVVDGQRMLVGSHNLTKESLDTRREISILVQDADWAARVTNTLANDRKGLKPKAGPVSIAKAAAGSAVLAPSVPIAAPTAVRAEAAPSPPASGGTAGAPNPTANAFQPAAGAGVKTGQDIVGGDTRSAAGNRVEGSIQSAFVEDHWATKLLHMLAAALFGAAVAYRPWRRLIPGAAMPIRETADTQVMIAVAGAVMVTVIGDSVARAFGLVGLGGLIRFRSLIRDTRDAGLMFVMIAIGMACGLDLLGLAATIAGVAFVGLTIFDATDRDQRTRISVKVDEPRTALQAIRTNFPHARILEAPNTKVMAPGAGTVVMELNGEAQGADAAQILDMLRARGVTGVRSVVLEED